MKKGRIKLHVSQWTQRKHLEYGETKIWIDGAAIDKNCWIALNWYVRLVYNLDTNFTDFRK